MTFYILQGGVVMSSQITHSQSSNIHQLAHILDTCTSSFSSVHIWSQPHHGTASLRVITTRARDGSPKEHRAKQKWLCETHSVTCIPGISMLSDNSCIVMQPPPSFLCCPRPPSHHLSSLTIVSLVPTLTSAINTLLTIQYSSILSTCPNHLNTLWSALLTNTLSIPAIVCTSSFLTLSNHV